MILYMPHVCFCPRPDNHSNFMQFLYCYQRPTALSGTSWRYIHEAVTNGLFIFSGIHGNSHLTNLPSVQNEQIEWVSNLFHLGYPTYSLRFLAQTTPGCTWLKRPKTTHLCVQPHIGTVLALHTSTSTWGAGSSIAVKITLPETNMDPQNRPSQKEIIFQPPNFGTMLVSGRVHEVSFLLLVGRCTLHNWKQKRRSRAGWCGTMTKEASKRQDQDFGFTCIYWVLNIRCKNVVISCHFYTFPHW